ncbi:hypothetical protein CALVIDRAFT_600999 [Calocera viscosa TUFC12733]|uniref:Peptidase C14 caspase domain-containing protein n=1 Tax=Calocera viscosa (strain TUFC12733) TaxID=1330018 RepID=A0A167IY92_CALVF|nr:hypothetical protein CALVIDRAFT_600999 [Calocera viscosa TUFC12733]
MAAPFSAYDESTDPTFWRALLIGISYKNHPNKRAHLKGTHRDVRLMKAFLMEQGWLEENIIVLTDEESIETTKAAAIMNGIDTLIAPAVEKPDQSYRLVFYYAGHGALEPDPTHREPNNQGT